MKYIQQFACAVLGMLWLSAALAQVKLSDAARKNLGIEVTAVAVTTIAKTWNATAQVLDPAALIAQLGDIRAAEQQAKSSHNEADRLARLYQADSTVSLKALEAARAQFSADAAKLESLRAQWLAAYGRALAALTETERHQLTNDLLAGRSVLVRAETLQGVPLTISFRTARVRALSGDAAWDGRVLGVAAAAVQAVGNAYLIKIQASLPSGTLLTAELNDPTAVLQGVKIPRTAIIRWQGGDWVYVESAPNTFQRIALRPTVWLSDGCLVQERIASGSKVVSAGAAMLIAAESRPVEE